MSRFADIAELHAVAETWQASRCLAEHAALEAFSSAVGQLTAELDEQQDDPYWAPVVRALRRARWDMATVPLPFSDPALGLADALDSAVPRLRRADLVAPDLADAAYAVADQLEELAGSEDDPLGEVVIRQLVAAGAVAETAPAPPAPHGGERPETAVLLRHGRGAPAVRMALAACGLHADVVTPAQLEAGRPYKAVVAVGPVSWFDPRVLRAPRARELIFAYFGWLRDTDPQLDLLVGAVARPHHSLSGPPSREIEVGSGGALETLASEWIPRADWSAIAAASRTRAPGEAAGEPVAAWLFALASAEGVYLEAGEGSRAYVAELEDELTVQQAATQDIAPGTFVVLRATGEGDYIKDIADTMLGDRAAELRDLQEWWKLRLRNRLDKLGIRNVMRRLEAAGAIRASEMNVRRWARADSIKTRDQADFGAIMDVIGAPDRAEELWDAMSTLDAAHQRAGMRVRQLLVAEIRAGDPLALAERGWSDYDVEEIQGEGALRVARVEGRSPEPLEVPRTRTRRPFPVDRDLWLG